MKKIKLEPIQALCECDHDNQCESCRSVIYADYDLKTLHDEYLAEVSRITKERERKENSILYQMMQDLGISSFLPTKEGIIN